MENANFEDRDEEKSMKLMLECHRVLPGLMKQRLEDIRRVDPNAQLTPEACAEVIDEAKVMAGYERIVKADPEALLRQTPEMDEARRLLRQISEDKEE